MRVSVFAVCCFTAVPVLPPGAEHAGLPAPAAVRALSRQERIDVVWDVGAAGRQFQVERASAFEGPYRELHEGLLALPAYSDFIGEPGAAFHYRVRAVTPGQQGRPRNVSGWTRPVSGTTQALHLDTLLTEVQEAGFRYFYNYGHPASGLARESALGRHGEDVCASGATGMGLFNLVVGIERGFVTREDAASRARTILRFLGDKAQRHHGAFPHWLHGATGETIPFGRYDDGADLVETAFLASGFLVLREYFAGENDLERDVRTLADTLWREIEWDWFVQNCDGEAYLPWHWSPTHGFDRTMPITGFNEAQIAYLLAVGSPTHPVSTKVYWSGWETETYGEERTVLGLPFGLHRGLGGALFLTHYSHLGLDPASVYYNGRSNKEHFTNWCRVQVRHARSRSHQFKGYDTMWGLTSSLDPRGYRNHSPGKRDNGTLAPTASLSSMPYLPDEAIACLLAMYERGDRLWGPFGFYDAFNLNLDWVGEAYLGIDVGPIGPMIENYRTGFCWKTFMRAPEIGEALHALGIDEH